jgi:hypothetical protein
MPCAMPGRLSPLHVTMRQRLENEAPERGDSNGDSAGTDGSRRFSLATGGSESPCVDSDPWVFRLRFFAGPSLPGERRSSEAGFGAPTIWWAGPFDAPSPSVFLAFFPDIPLAQAGSLVDAPCVGSAGFLKTWTE